MKIWVVEMKNEDVWESTVGVGLSRECAREEMEGWASANPRDKFRVAKYTRAETSKRPGAEK